MKYISLIRLLGILCCLFISSIQLFSQGNDTWDDSTATNEIAKPLSPDSWHAEAGFTGRLTHNQIAAGNEADAALMLSGQGQLFDSPIHLDVAFSGSLGAPHDLGTGWEETFTLYAFSVGLGETWLLAGNSWYYNAGGGLGFHVGDLRYRAYDGASPDDHETATFFGAYLRGNLMYRVSHAGGYPIYAGVGAIGQGTTTTHLLGKRLSDSGVSIGLFVGIGL